MCFLVDYESIMEERKRIADEEERKRKEYELKVNSIRFEGSIGFEPLFIDFFLRKKVLKLHITYVM